jgi:antitoxin ParD1/3/4
MHIEIPAESEQFVQARAAAAGFDNVQDYVLNLILEDDAAQFDRTRLERLAIEGLESGDAGTLTQADWQEMRAKLEQRISQHQ